MEIKKQKKGKKSNDLVLIHIGDKDIYFTTCTFAGNYLGIQANSVAYAITHKKVLMTTDDEKVTIELVDGSEVPYKLINNY